MAIHDDTKIQIEEILRQAFKPSMLEVINESYQHAGHAEAKAHPAAGHFKVIMQSELFNNLSAVKRHRLVYEQLSSLMDAKIHALSLDLRASNE